VQLLAAFIETSAAQPIDRSPDSLPALVDAVGSKLLIANSGAQSRPSERTTTSLPKEPRAGVSGRGPRTYLSARAEVEPSLRPEAECVREGLSRLERASRD